MAGQNFRTFFQFPSLNSVQWYPGHMAKGMHKMQAVLVRCDCVLEVRDARIPFSSRNEKFSRILAGRPRVLILNKADLSAKNTRKQIVERLGKHEIIFTNSAKQYHPSIRQIIPAALRSMNEHGISSDNKKGFFRIMVIGLPNVGKSSVINAIRRIRKNKGNAAHVGGVPGITRAVQTNIEVCSNPKTFLVDTPGIMPTYVRDVEVGFKLALVGTIKDHLIGEEYIADYLLFTLNRQKQFSYVEYFGLDDCTDDIDQLLVHIGHKMGALRKGGVLDLKQAATRFLTKFRHGHLGTILLDKIHKTT
ncbi:Mitochondrial ribosome-associated GTPase 1 [Trichoplax sp. H2]|nr:Mitochondrial ribosome-associated GTPase 1 [Trichoplax sp. H2]|eukprot:RDD47830.1 Mitochondrial ribosome-associated GTPase 1 [Trichoplax sp. H2]